MSLTRRILGTFLALAAASSLVLAAGPQDLSTFMGSAPPCLPDAKPTPAVAADNTFKAGAPLRPVLAGMDDHVCPRVTCWWWYVMQRSDARADPLVDEAHSSAAKRGRREPSRRRPRVAVEGNESRFTTPFRGC